jgi:ENTS family enterobactin (siderophore) exporter
MSLGWFSIDVTPLRASAAFRWLYGARLCSLLVYGIQGVTVSLQAYALTGSSLHVALLGLTMAVPMTVFLVLGGVLADRCDRRVLMVGARAAYLTAVALLLGNALLAHPKVWPLYAAAAIGGITGGISTPALMAVTPALVGKEHLTAASALSALAAQTGAIIGPCVAGLLVAQAGFAACYAIVAVGASLTPIFLSRLPFLPPNTVGQTVSVGALVQGVRFVLKSRLVAGLLLIDVAATIFATLFALLPQYGAEMLGGSQVVGMLYAAPAVGAFLAALTSGWSSRVPWPGKALIGAVLAWGMAAMGVGLAPNIPLALAALCAMGFADTVSEMLRIALLQRHTPDHLLGRISSLWMIQAMVSPALGNMQTGFLARVASPRFALICGGAVSVAASVLIARAWPALRNAR